MKAFPSGAPFIHITTLIHCYYYKNEKKVHNNTLKTSICSFTGSSDVKLQILAMAAKGMCVGYISSLISQKRKVT